MKLFAQIGIRHVIGAIFLGLQILSIAYARIGPERFFCWAPYDQRSQYRIEVQMDDRALPDAEIAQRYRYPARGWEARSLHNVISIVRQFERTYGRSDDAHVTIHYRINGHPEETWTWPER